MQGGSTDARDDLLTLKVTELKVSLPNSDSSLLAEPLLVEPQERLKAAGLPVSGKKDVLVDRLLASIIADEHEQVHGASKPEVQKEEEAGEKDVEVEAVVVQEVEEVVEPAIQAVEVAARPREEEMEVEMERPAKRVRIEEALVPEEVKIEPKLEEVKPDVVFWGGDSVPHNVDSLDFDSNVAIMKNTTKIVSDGLRDLRIFPTIGNHDTYP